MYLSIHYINVCGIFCYTEHIFTMLCVFTEAQQRLLLVTVFALSVRYQPVDVSLAISSGLLDVLSQLCGTETLLGQTLQLLHKPAGSQLSTALKVASTRLLQILAISTGYNTVHSQTVNTCFFIANLNPQCCVFNYNASAWMFFRELQTW